MQETEYRPVSDHGVLHARGNGLHPGKSVRMLCLCGMVWVVGCHSATGEHAGVPGEQTTLTSTSPKTPEQPKQFMPGPTIRPSGPLLRWLNNTVPSVSGPRVRVRLPVIIRFYQPHQPPSELLKPSSGRWTRLIPRRCCFD